MNKEQMELLSKLGISVKDFEVLEDVLSEIQEFREYEGEDLKALRKLKRIFSFQNWKKYRVHKEPRSKAERMEGE